MFNYLAVESDGQGARTTDSRPYGILLHVCRVLNKSLKMDIDLCIFHGSQYYDTIVNRFVSLYFSFEPNRCKIVTHVKHNKYILS